MVGSFIGMLRPEEQTEGLGKDWFGYPWAEVSTSRAEWLSPGLCQMRLEAQERLLRIC